MSASDPEAERGRNQSGQRTHFARLNELVDARLQRGRDGRSQSSETVVACLDWGDGGVGADAGDWEEERNSEFVRFPFSFSSRSNLPSESLALAGGRLSPLWIRPDAALEPNREVGADRTG